MRTCAFRSILWAVTLLCAQNAVAPMLSPAGSAAPALAASRKALSAERQRLRFGYASGCLYFPHVQPELPAPPVKPERPADAATPGARINDRIESRSARRKARGTATPNSKTSDGRDAWRTHRAADRLSFRSIQGEGTTAQSDETSVGRDTRCAHRAAHREQSASTYAFLALAAASSTQCHGEGLVRKPQCWPQRMHACRSSLRSGTV